MPRRIASSSVRPRARLAAIAADRVHPVPCVARVAMRGGDEFGEEPSVEEEVARLAAARVPALDEDGPGAELRDQAGGQAPVGRGPDADSRERLGLGEVGRDQVGERQETAAQAGESRLREEPRAGLGHHHRVEHDVLRVMALERRGDGADARRVEQHADLDGARAEVVEDGVDLPCQEPGRKGLDREDTQAVLGRPGGEGRRSMDPVRRERQQVRLDAGPATRVGGRDRERRNRTKSARPGSLLHTMEILWPAPFP